MKNEMDSLLGNQIWELIELTVGKKVLHNKWVYRIKNEHDSSKRSEEHTSELQSRPKISYAVFTSNCSRCKFSATIILSSSLIVDIFITGENISV